MTLFEINEQLRNFEYEFDEETGEVLNEDEFNALEVAQEEKLEAIGCIIKEKVATAEALKAEIKNMRDRMDKEIKDIERMKAWYGQCLGNKPFSTTKVQVSFRKSETTDILQEQMIPEEYIIKEIKPVTRPDKDRIKKAIKAGIDVPGAVVTEHYNIQIK